MKLPDKYPSIYNPPRELESRFFNKKDECPCIKYVDALTGEKFHLINPSQDPLVQKAISDSFIEILNICEVIQVEGKHYSKEHEPDEIKNPLHGAIFEDADIWIYQQINGDRDHYFDIQENKNILKAGKYKYLMYDFNEADLDYMSDISAQIEDHCYCEDRAIERLQDRVCALAQRFDPQSGGREYFYKIWHSVSQKYNVNINQLYDGFLDKIQQLITQAEKLNSRARTKCIYFMTDYDAQVA